jgi:DNA helicase-2/ATP-dependent DNA helicase PcrA
MTQDEAKLKEKIEQLHSNDPMQLKAIYSNSKRLLIEAPAGYGKTKTMISKIAYLLVTKKLSSNKKILALSFSVNAAYKIKKDVTSQLPQLIEALDFNINDKLFISNYHGLCRRILKYYGYLLHQNLREIDNLTSINDDDYQELMSLKVGLRHEEAELLTKISDSVKNINNANYKFLLDNWDDYIQIVCKKLITNKYIPYNAILMFVVQLLKSYTEIKSFYQKYFEIIIVDEFQDTNILSFLVLDQLIGEDNQVVFIGDSLQRIYGFIGAIPNLLEKCRKRYKMDKITLSQNYRFKDNPQMLLLEKNIRANAENLSKPSISQNALIPLVVLDNQEEEAIWVANKVIELKEEKESNRIAILSRSRGKNIDVIINNSTFAAQFW